MVEEEDDGGVMVRVRCEGKCEEVGGVGILIVV